MRNTKYMAELFSLGFLILDNPLFNLFIILWCIAVLRGLDSCSLRSKCLIIKYSHLGDVDRPVFNILIVVLTCTYCPSPPGQGVSRHIVSVGELAFFYSFRG